MRQIGRLIGALGWLGSICGVALAAPPPLPPGYPPGMYDEDKVPAYTLPDPLIAADGTHITTAKQWMQKRRPEILELFAREVYGHTMIGRTPDMSWAVTYENDNAQGGKAVDKYVSIYFTKAKDWPRLDIHITLPKSKKPMPVFVEPSFFHQADPLLARGYGLVSYDPNQIDPDRPGLPYESSIRHVFDPAGQTAPQPDEWATLGVWAWAASRAMDYIESDKAIDAKKVVIMGVSRYGKTAMWAGAQDPRFAIVISGESGTGGAVLVRRCFGETVTDINTAFPYWFDDNFKKYNDKPDQLPVDWHELIALIAPRPVYVAVAEGDIRGDPHGSFLAAKAAEPVYALFHEKGMGVAEMPSVATPVGDYIGFHERTGSHGQNDYDWEQMLNFTDKHFHRSHS